VVFRETISIRATKKDRPRLEEALNALEEGDQLVVANLDRLGRDKRTVVYSLHVLLVQGIYIRTMDNLVKYQGAEKLLAFSGQPGLKLRQSHAVAGGLGAVEGEAEDLQGLRPLKKRKKTDERRLARSQMPRASERANSKKIGGINSRLCERDNRIQRKYQTKNVSLFQ